LVQVRNSFSPNNLVITLVNKRKDNAYER